MSLQKDMGIVPPSAIHRFQLNLRQPILPFGAI